jgi:hypothetical protein
MDATGAVRQLGGDVRPNEAENLEALVSEILILRQKLADSENSEVRAERRIGKEIEARQRAEQRASAAEDALSTIETAIARSRRKTISEGGTLRGVRQPGRTGIEPAKIAGIAKVGEGAEYPRIEAR